MCGILVFGCSEPPAPVADQTETETTAALVDELVTIRTLTPGDRACYVGVQAGEGPVREEEAAFELCDRMTLIGKQVRLEREMTEVMARSCEGNPECTDRDTVNLIVSAEPVSP